MKAVIIYHSAHHNNTEKVAKAIAQVFGAKLLKVEEVNVHKLHKCDLIGFGSGIYHSKHHKVLLDFLDKLPILSKKVFVFSTSGKGSIANFHDALKEKLLYIKCQVMGEFSCKGFDTFGPLKLIGGINKGRPNEKDLEDARNFALSLKGKIK
jgi:flavodoxin